MERIKLEFFRKYFKRIMLGGVIAAICVIVSFFIVASDGLDVTHYDVVSENLPPAFDGFKIVQLSDVHNAMYPENNRRIVRIVREEKPDMIAVTGDLVDTALKDPSKPGILMRDVVEIVPACYYVTGNHEYEMGHERYTFFENVLKKNGVQVLRNRSTFLSRGNDSILLIGIDDPSFITEEDSLQKSAIDKELSEIHLPNDKYKLLLSHRPETLDIYASHDIDLVLTGHAHGGQLRGPIFGCLYAPHQGWFPKYVQGTFKQGRTTMVISRGLGYSTLPFRINNNPEIVIVTLHRGF